MKKLKLLLALLIASQSYGIVLLSDNFDDGIIDPAKWIQTLQNGNSSLTESGGTLTTQARGILGSVADITGEYSISGKFTMNDGLEHFKVSFRTDLSDSGSSGERNGMLVAFSNDNDQISIQKFNGASNLILAQKSYTLTEGQLYNFQIEDNGTSIAFSVNGAEELSASDTFSSGSKVGFYSREFSGTSTSVDEFLVVVPEPASLGFILGAFALFMTTKRRGHNGRP